jgi:enoyl-CoA hydratase/carnithine racemase
VTSEPVSPLVRGVRLDREGPVATVTLSRPDVLNAQTPGMWDELRRFGDDLPGDVRVVVVRGEGRSFSAGLDLKQAALSSDNSQSAAPTAAGANFGHGSFAELVRLPPDECAARIAEYQEAFAWLRRPDLISVARVQGHAIGAGFQLALACDLRVLAHDARLAMAEVTLGLVPDLGGTKRLVELVGYARALELCVTGRRLDAAEADRIGLATVVVPGEQLDGAVADLVAAVLAAPRDAVVEIKALLAGAAGRSYEAQLRAEREAQTRRLRDLAGLGE